MDLNIEQMKKITEQHQFNRDTFYWILLTNQANGEEGLEGGGFRYLNPRYWDPRIVLIPGILNWGYRQMFGGGDVNMYKAQIYIN